MNKKRISCIAIFIYVAGQSICQLVNPWTAELWNKASLFVKVSHFTFPIGFCIALAVWIELLINMIYDCKTKDFDYEYNY